MQRNLECFRGLLENTNDCSNLAPCGVSLGHSNMAFFGKVRCVDECHHFSSCWTPNFPIVNPQGKGSRPLAGRFHQRRHPSVSVPPGRTDRTLFVLYRGSLCTMHWAERRHTLPDGTSPRPLLPNPAPPIQRAPNTLSAIFLLLPEQLRN